jgi:O-methyltransferase domain
VPVQIARAHEHITGAGSDLPALESIFDAYVARFGLGQRLGFTAGEFFTDPPPHADVLVMGHILHDWDLDHRPGPTRRRSRSTAGVLGVGDLV